MPNAIHLKCAGDVVGCLSALNRVLGTWDD